MKHKKTYYTLWLALVATPLQLFAEDSIPKNLQITNPVGATSVPALINNVVSVILGVVGAIALAMFIYGGMMWMTSAGNQQRIEKGRETLIWATIGLLIIFASYAILRTVLQIFKGGS